MDRYVIETDLLVAGGGMAGVCAAIAAARQGARVVLVQDRSVLGGNASSEIRMHIVGADIHGGRRGWRESGLIEELRLEDAVRNPARCYPLWDVILYERVTAEPNITLLLDTDVVGVQMEFLREGSPQRPTRTGRLYESAGGAGRIKSARAVRFSTEDEFEIRAKVYADCTGDGRLGFEAGADFRIGRESKAMHGEPMAQDCDDRYTLGSSILLTSREHGHPVPFVAPAWARQFDPEKLKVGRGIHSWEYGFWWIEWGGMLDTIKDNATTIRRELYAISLGVWNYVKNSGRFPESANWALDWIGAVPGKRESRRFLGPHLLTQQDLMEARVHDDEVAYGGWSIDLHPPAGIDAITEPPCWQVNTPRCYGIPLRCYFSRNIGNLFFAGRNISATHVAFASTRVMATCAVGGQAVGVAAAHCVREGIVPADVVASPAAIRAVQQKLLHADATLLNIRPEPNKAHSATLRASSAIPGSPADNLLDGITRDQVDEKTGELVRSHSWRSAPLDGTSPQRVEFNWDCPQSISEIVLIVDTGFQRELLLSASDHHTRKVIRGPQPETVKDYDILIDGRIAFSVRGGYQRRQSFRLPEPVSARSVRIDVHATNGIAEARIFEVSVH